MAFVTDSALGGRLRALRESRDLTRPDAERLGALGTGTLKAWESGSRMPRGPALGRLLDALETADRQRAELVALADPRHARLSLASYPAGPPIELGALLRAFRLRKGWTQADAARALEATQGAVAHWEAGERRLEGPALHRALFALGATVEEVAATLASPYAERSPSDDPALVQWVIERIPGVLREPLQLANERALWWNALRQPGWEVYLREAMVNRAVWYAHMRRFDEIEPLWRRIRTMAPDPGADPGANKVAIVLADVRFRPTAPASRLLRRLERIVSSLDHSAERVWARGTQAVALSSLGERRAIDVARQARREASEVPNALHETWNRTVDLAEAHLRLGEPEQALDALGEGGPGLDYDLWRGGFGLVGLPVRARALAALDREPEPELVATLRTHVATDGTPFYENVLEIVERDLAAMRRRRSSSI